MKHLKALGLLGSSLLIMGMLSACQSTRDTTDPLKTTQSHLYGMKHHGMSEEQKQQWQQQRQQACDGKAVGDSVVFKQGHHTKVGQCQVQFKLDDNSKTLLRQTLTATERLSRQAFNQMTIEQREQIRLQRQAKRTERQALRAQLQSACQDQAAGQTVQVQYNNQKLTGQCVLQYQPEHMQTVKHG
ncbi:hypothetical protein [Acinetobacter rudis]|uniref:Uncharacterized protein n=1 Tax=Acinetobacter rudis TaxID=632955 RepID=A0AAW8J7T3_9GAMM|nr:hypothetical protein [Acinetobacter rudis]MDQ8935518.1 hypothetical protein [Acinetobacter rudis]MDQ8953592.1 hypothetical protein [Acinetobacter rudis]MDQ9017715.1 hypothetical protein [Acinetobacter rudis]